MPPRKKKTRRRRDTSLRLLNVLEAYTYASILSQRIMGNSPWGFVTGEQDLTQRSSYDSSVDTTSLSWVGGAQSAGGISLRDLATEPRQAISEMAGMFQANMANMAIQGIMVGASFKFGKRLLRRQINTVNRSIFKPLGMGVKL